MIWGLVGASPKMKKKACYNWLASKHQQSSCVHPLPRVLDYKVCASIHSVFQLILGDLNSSP